MTTTPPDMSEPAIVTRIREICLDYPQTSEDIKWENTVFLVREKIFALVSLQDDGQVGVWLKAAKGVQEAFGRSRSRALLPAALLRSEGMGWSLGFSRVPASLAGGRRPDRRELPSGSPKRVVRLLPDERTGNRK